MRGKDVVMIFREPMTLLNRVLTIGGRLPVSRVDQPAACPVHRKASALPVSRNRSSMQQRSPAIRKAPIADEPCRSLARLLSADLRRKTRG
jgi:hypothetical protein